MKAIAEANWTIKILQTPKSLLFHWEAETEDDLGIHNNGEWKSQGFQSNKEAIKNDWRAIAALNNITNYKFVE